MGNIIEGNGSQVPLGLFLGGTAARKAEPEPARGPIGSLLSPIGARYDIVPGLRRGVRLGQRCSQHDES